jgi:two-component system sensor histidine kinase UhpB
MKYLDRYLSEELKTTKIIQDVMIIGGIILMVSLISWTFSVFHLSSHWLADNQFYQIDLLVISAITLGLAMPVFSVRRWKEQKSEILKRKQMEKRMEKSGAQLQAVLDGVPDMILQVDTNLRISWANKAALSLDPLAIGKVAPNAFGPMGESVIASFSRWAITTGVIEKGMKFQPATYGSDVGTYWEGIGVPLRGTDNKVYGAISIARDVTERMRVEHTSNLLASIVESTDDAIFGLSFDGTVLSWNKGAEKTYGYQAHEIVGKTGTVLSPVFQRKELLKAIERVIRNQTLERFDTIRTRKDGKEIHVSVTLCPYVDATGRKIGVSAIDRDITEKKLAEEALIESETRFRELFENMSSGVAVNEAIDNGNDFIIRDYNSAGISIEKAERHQFIGQKCSDIFRRQNSIGLIDIYRKVWRTGEPEHLLVTLMEGDVVVSWRDMSIYKLPSGEIVAIFDDITERRNSEDALEKSEAKFRTLVETAPDGIILFDPAGKIIQYNEAFSGMFGYSSNELDNMEFPVIFPRQEGKKEFVELSDIINEKRNVLAREFSAVKKDKQRVPVEVSLSALRDERGNLQAFIAIVRDISVRKKYELELRSSREQLRSLAVHLQKAREEERKRIAFEIHDELGYALTAFKLDLIWLVKKMNVKDDILIAKTKEMTELIETTIQKVRTISTALRPSILDHFGLIAAIEWQANEFQKRTAVRCRVVTDPKEVKLPDLFATAVFRIFQETLTNVARHSKASRVDVSFLQKTDNFELKISDNGIGISDERMKHTTSLGLVGMRERANSIGASLNIGAGVEGGTSVTLTIPIKNEEIKND